MVGDPFAAAGVAVGGHVADVLARHHPDPWVWVRVNQDGCPVNSKILEDGGIRQAWDKAMDIEKAESSGFAIPHQLLVGKVF